MAKAIKEVVRLTKDLIVAWFRMKRGRKCPTLPGDYMLELGKDNKAVIINAGGEEWEQTRKSSNTCGSTESEREKSTG